MKLPTIEEQVCLYEQAVKIKELGVELDTYFIYLDGFDFKQELTRKISGEIPGHVKIYPAPTVAELGVLLPCGIECENTFYHLFISKPKAGGAVVEYVFGNGETILSIYRSIEAHARAEAFIWLIENGYIKDYTTMPENPRTTIIDETPTR